MLAPAGFPGSPLPLSLSVSCAVCRSELLFSPPSDRRLPCAGGAISGGSRCREGAPKPSLGHPKINKKSSWGVTWVSKAFQEAPGVSLEAKMTQKSNDKYVCLIYVDRVLGSAIAKRRAFRFVFFVMCVVNIGGAVPKKARSPVGCATHVC